MESAYGEKLGRAMALLSQRSAMLQGEAAEQDYAEAAELMADLAGGMHLALPEQRAIASKLITMGLDGIQQAEQHAEARPVEGVMETAGAMTFFPTTDITSFIIENGLASFAVALCKCGMNPREVLAGKVIMMPMANKMNEIPVFDYPRGIENLGNTLKKHVINPTNFALPMMGSQTQITTLNGTVTLQYVEEPGMVYGKQSKLMYGGKEVVRQGIKLDDDTIVHIIDGVVA